jgi:hypothetical protein
LQVDSRGKLLDVILGSFLKAFNVKHTLRISKGWAYVSTCIWLMHSIKQTIYKCLRNHWSYREEVSFICCPEEDDCHHG